MPTNRKLLGAAAFSLALAGGGAAGALLGTPSLSGAQDGTEDTADAPGRRRRPRSARRAPGPVPRTAAEALGITEDELRTALEDGQSIAQVAEADGVDVQTVIDASSPTARSGSKRPSTTCPDRMAELVEREGLPDRGGPGGPGGPGGRRVRRPPRRRRRGHRHHRATSSAPRSRTARRSRTSPRQRRRRADRDRRPRRRGHGPHRRGRSPTATSPRRRPTERKANLEERITAASTASGRTRPPERRRRLSADSAATTRAPSGAPSSCDALGEELDQVGDDEPDERARRSPWPGRCSASGSGGRPARTGGPRPRWRRWPPAPTTMPTTG